MPPKSGSPARYAPKGLTILHEDRDLIVIDKPSGLLSMGTDRDKTRTAHTILNDYVRKGDPRSRQRVYIVHRLDRETSGILLFARSEEAKLFLQQHWDETEKTYLAVVHGTPSPPEGTITSYLAENSALKVYSTQNPQQGKLSTTVYKVVQEHRGVSLLELRLLTGRKHQIRVHLAELGHPVVGDDKYGDGRNGYKRLALHARTLTFTHPHSGQRLTCETALPDFILPLLGRR